MCQLPANTTTPMALARRLRKLSQKKCIITHTTIARWCAEGLLDSGRNEIRKSWIITNESAADIEKALRRNGWNSREAASELRMLYHQRLAANGCQAPPSLAVERLADMRNTVEADWQKKTSTETGTARVNGDNTRPDASPTTQWRAYSDLGIDVNPATMMIRGNGKTVRFARTDVQWPIFEAALAAFPKKHSWDDVKFPGKLSREARYNALGRLNRKLMIVGVQLRECILSRIGKTSDNG
jgi:hypothetical protein